MLLERCQSKKSSLKGAYLRSTCMSDTDPGLVPASCKGRSEDAGIEAKHSGSSDPCEFAAA